MNVPAIAKRSFDALQNNGEYVRIVNFVLTQLQKLKSKVRRARFVHELVDKYNEEVFSHPLVKQLSPCTVGCTGCCHTQVSVTEDEAHLLVQLINDGVKIDLDRLKVQMQAEDDPASFYALPFQQRKCVFLDEKGACRVYEDRPSVCRTNAVLGDASQCDTSEKLKPTRLVLTQKADMVIYASYLNTASAGSLPHMVGKILGKAN